LKTSVRVIAS